MTTPRQSLDDILARVIGVVAADTAGRTAEACHGYRRLGQDLAALAVQFPDQRSRQFLVEQAAQYNGKADGLEEIVATSLPSLPSLPSQPPPAATATTAAPPSEPDGLPGYTPYSVAPAAAPPPFAPHLDLHGDLDPPLPPSMPNPPTLPPPLGRDPNGPALAVPVESHAFLNPPTTAALPAAIPHLESSFLHPDMPDDRQSGGGRAAQSCASCFQRFHPASLFSHTQPKFCCLYCSRHHCGRCSVTERPGEWLVDGDNRTGHACIGCVKRTIGDAAQTLQAERTRWAHDRAATRQMQSLQTRMNGVLLRSQADQAQLARERSADQERALQVEAELFMERRQQEEERNRDRLRQTTIAANTATMVGMGYDAFDSKMALIQHAGNIERARDFLHSRRRQAGPGVGGAGGIRSDELTRYTVSEPVGANPNLFHGLDKTAGADQDGNVPVLVYKAAVDRAGGSLQFTDALVQIGAAAGADAPGMLRCEAVCNESDAVYLIFTVPPECRPEGMYTLDAFLAKHSAGAGEADQADSNVEFELVRMFQQLFLGLGLFHGVQYCSEIKGPMDVLVIEATNGDTSAVLLPSFGRDRFPDEVLPPEVLAGAPWAWMGDLWSMGVIMYRGVFGGSPVLMPDDSYPKCRQLPLESTPAESRPVVRSPQIQMGCRELLEAGLLQRDPGARPAAHTVTNHWLFQSSRYKMMQEAGAVVALDTKKKSLAFVIKLMQPPGRTRNYLRVTRNFLIDSVCQQVLNIPERQLVGQFSVNFEGEAGIDAGGLTTELYQQFFTALFASDGGDGGLFCTSEDAGVEAVYLPGVPQADASREIATYRARLYEAVGRLLVKAIFDEISVPVRLGLAVFKYFLDQEPSLSDLEQFDPSMVRSLRELLKLDDASLLCLDFSEFGPGDDREVTNQNRKEYVRKKAQQVLFRDRELALVAMKKGFESIAISPQLRIFSAGELAQLLQGNQHVDAESVLEILRFEGYSTSAVPDAVREFLGSIPSASLKRFLCFVTAHGCVPKPPLIVRNTSNEDRMFPVAHTCFNRLDLPDYSDLALVPTRLQYVIDHLEAAGFGLA